MSVALTGALTEAAEAETAMNAARRTYLNCIMRCIGEGNIKVVREVFWI
jgi:hypothetical protein